MLTLHFFDGKSYFYPNGMLYLRIYAE